MVHVDSADVILISDAHRTERLDIIRLLFREYADALSFDLGFQSFNDELGSLPGSYAPPSGRLIAALDGAEPAGCVALHNLGEGYCEMKRLYVRPAYRGRKIGRALAKKAILEARGIGYRAMRLDTVSSMTEAIALYRALGFYAIAPYRFNPLRHALYFERILS
jgi:ribosomal protein S18 acetylase RimI-like enzyme